MYKQIINVEDCLPSNDNTTYVVKINKMPLQAIPKKLRECANCNKIGEGYLKCSSCKSTHYCSNECYKNNYKTHKHVCEISDAISGIDYNKKINITTALNHKLAKPDIKQSAIYTSGKKYWRISIDDWEAEYLNLVSIEREDVEELFNMCKYDDESSHIFIYNEPDKPQGIKINAIDKIKL